MDSNEIAEANFVPSPTSDNSDKVPSLLPSGFTNFDFQTAASLTSLPFPYMTTESLQDFTAASALQATYNQLWSCQVLNEVFNKIEQQQAEPQPQVEQQNPVKSKLRSLLLQGKGKQGNSEPSQDQPKQNNYNCLEGSKNKKSPKKVSEKTRKKSESRADFVTYCKSMEPKPYCNGASLQDEPLDLSRKSNQKKQHENEVQKDPLDLSMPKVWKPKKPKKPKIAQERVVAKRTITIKTPVQRKKPKIGKKGRVIVSRLQHLQVLASTFLHRHNELDIKEKLSECSACGSCSFALNPSDVMKWMRIHLYSHAPGLFKCKLCGECEGFSAGMVKTHLLQVHGAESAVRSNIYDRRAEMDQELVDLVHKCFPKSKGSIDNQTNT